MKTVTARAKKFSYMKYGWIEMLKSTVIYRLEHSKKYVELRPFSPYVIMADGRLFSWFTFSEQIRSRRFR
jgi:hypothetical protein